MNDGNLNPKTEDQGLEEIPKWTRRYAQSRTIPFLIFMTVFLALCIAIGGSISLAAIAFRTGYAVWFWICIAVLVISLLCCVWFSLFGDKGMERLAQRFYDKEGNVTMTPPKLVLADYIVGGLFLGSILASVTLGRDIPTKYMQPVSALYAVPLLIYMTWRRRRISGWGPLLWPVLYALHALLIVLGVPIVFEGKWQTLNMSIPTIGYGLLAGLIGHIYNRYALKRLRAFAGARE